MSIDSRTCALGELFVALVGPNFDGHEFVGAAFAAGAAAAVVHRDAAAAAGPAIVVDDTADALTALGRHARARMGGRVVAVTGSVGKTGTKEAIACALGALAPTHASTGNLNNQWGVPLSLARMPAAIGFGVFELGMNHPGELAPLSRLVRPDVAVITTVAAAHLEFFDSIVAIAEEKAEIFDGMGPGGIAILNRDIAYFALLAAAAWDRGIERLIGFGAHPEADVRLDDYQPAAGGGAVAAAIGARRIDYRLPLGGRHWAMNSLAVLAVVEALGDDVARAAGALETMAVPAGRGRRHGVEFGAGAFEIIDDSYNANPASMRAAITMLGDGPVAPGGRRIAVLGDMLELGPEGGHMHARLARYLVAQDIDLVFTAGPLMAELDAALPAERRGGHATDAAALLPIVVDRVRAGDVVLVKGSLGSDVGPIVAALRALDPGATAPAAAAC